MGTLSFFILEVDVAYEVGVSDLSTVWDVMFSNWEHGSSSLGYFFCWTVSNSIGEEMSKFIYIPSFPAVRIRDLG